MDRVSIFNCVSTAYEMLRFSSDAIINNAGYDNFDYIIVTWGPTPEVSEYLNNLKDKYNFVHVINYKTNHSVPYVPNLRGMMNLGFEYGFSLNNYCGLTNTDQYFGKDWLINLVKYANENDIVNSTILCPLDGLAMIVADCGVPEYGKFNLDKFNAIYDKIFEDRVQTQEERGGHWNTTCTMPYLIPKRFWKLAGPWELRVTGPDAPDVKFFERCSRAGAHFTMSRSSITYHHHAVERSSGNRPEDAKNMAQE
jgi:hypothetical protein